MMNFTGLSEICTIYWLHYFKYHTNIQRNMALTFYFGFGYLNCHYDIKLNLALNVESRRRI